MWFGNKVVSNSACEQPVYAQSAHGESSDRLAYSIGITNANKLLIPRPRTSFPTSCSFLNNRSSTNLHLKVS